MTTWNANAGKAAVASCTAPFGNGPAEARLYAMVHVAIHDALNAIDRRSRPYAFDVRANAPASVDAAVAAAAHDVLVAVIGQLALLPGAARDPVALVASDRQAALVDPGLRTPSGPPANLQAGGFEALVARMWQESATFRRQCLRLASPPTVTVTVRADPSRRGGRARAVTHMSRRAGLLISADVTLFSVEDATELIAHEIEHVIEQLDAVVLQPDECDHNTRRIGWPRESCRALEAGRRVLREVQEAQHRRMQTIRLRDPA